MQDLDIKGSYTGRGDKILNEFLLPVIKQSVKYDRVTSFYTTDSLIAISQGIESLYKKHGKIRLIIGVHSFPFDIADAILRREQFHEKIEQLNEQISHEITSISDALKQERLATIAWMIEEGLLEVKTAALDDGDGIFHPKTLIFADANGNRVVAVGSSNETSFGLGGNYEQLMVQKSWKDEDAVRDEEAFFNGLWNNTDEDAVVATITEEIARIIKDGLGEQYFKIKAKLISQIIKTDDIIDTSSKMPSNFFVSGDIPALYMHQERAVIDALSRWPVRVLFSDEVGLGKTFEVAATMAFLVKYCGVKRVVILTPKSVLKQWQNELYEHFDVNAWLYDSSGKLYRSATDEEKYIGANNNPLGDKSPDIILMSAQFARGGGQRGGILEQDDTILPDLLVLDEAHSARISKSLNGGSHKTRMYAMLENVTRKIPHLILATATPMQKDPEEYHSLLRLLGLPNAWQRPNRYLTSLSLTVSDDQPDNTDAKVAIKLLASTVNSMHPDLSFLTSDERITLKQAITIFEEDENNVYEFVQKNWSTLRSVFVKIHPAHLLTIRNTRKSLSEMGYKFPERNLIEESINDSDDIQLFYEHVDSYLTTTCFTTEEAIFPDKGKAIGFTKSSYQQRLASSLHSCERSLNNRLEKLNSIRKALDANLPQDKIMQILLNGEDLEDIDDEELYIDDDTESSNNPGYPNIEDIKRAVNLEVAELASLQKEAKQFLDNRKDLKIIRSIELATKCLNNGDKILLFSRYTDTVEALVNEFKRAGLDIYRYGIYTGKKSVIVSGGKENPCSKNDLKNELFSGRLRIVFCSDAASEGLNLQAARVLINVDVPWTPARLEQRIGRIARLGQAADKVDVYNVWYPESIEARMYHRIQKRLQQTNIAIGEFPDVMAAEIRNAILNDEDENDSAIEELKRIRTSKEMMALEKLWTPNTSKTISRSMREEMMKICDNNFPVDSDLTGDGIKHYHMPDDTIAELSANEGLLESISLKSLPWLYKNFESQSLSVVYGALGLPELFVFDDGSNKTPIKHESVLKIINNETLTEDDVLREYPIMLPDNRKMSLDYSVDVNLNNKPILWKGEKNEN